MNCHQSFHKIFLLQGLLLSTRRGAKLVMGKLQIINIFSILLLNSFLGFQSDAFAQQISGLKFYIRCHAHLVNERPHPQDSRMAAVIAGTKTGQQACLDLMNLGNLNPNGTLASSNILAKKIFQTMQELHNSWFDEHSFVATETHDWNDEIYDYNSMALYYTRALFDGNYQFSNIVTTSESIEPRRAINAASGSATVNDWAEGVNKAFSQLNMTLPWQHKSSEGDTFFNGQIVDKGPLIGWKPANRTNNINTNEFGLLEAHKNTLSAGVLTSPEYLILNTKIHKVGYTKKTNGAQQSYRRWGSRVVKNFLCRDLPVLTAEQAQPYVEPNSSIAFRQSASCMNCHATQDQLSYMIRHYTQKRVGRYTTSSAYPVFDVPAYYNNDLTNLPGTWESTPDNDFSRRDPKGKFVYVDMEGNFMQIPFDNIADFGTFLTSFDDFYTCTAKRYLKYFTGIDAYIGNINDLPLNDKELEHRQYAKDLGQILKNSQDPKQVIWAIFNSTYYKDKKYGGQPSGN